ncbi:uncharacterized protein LOC143260812 [Megalopta genalis]|uniref:uncharacterized protein LOC143260812 n=1 Tax=Megalopta genalis TaxID=115081 RepID=UPI003FD3F333
MDMLRKNFSSYSVLLSYTGLWPYGKSVVGTICRIGYTLLTLAVIGIQLSTMGSVEATSYNIATALSYSTPMLLCLLRYHSFLVNFPTLRSLYDNYENDLKSFKNLVELGMFTKHIQKGRRLVFVYIAIACALSVFSFTIIMIPTILHSKYQVYYLRVFGFFVSEQGLNTDLICLHVVIVSVMSFISVAGTESSLAIYTAYFCSLFEIASYRVQNAVNNVINSVAISKPIDIQPSVDLHRRAVQLLKYLTEKFAVTYLVAIAVSIVSFAISLYRLVLAIDNVTDVVNLILSAGLVITHLIIMFLNNYIGQELMDSSIQVNYDTYNSLWYCIPPESQKLLLFLLMRTKNEARYDLAGLFSPCHEGFSMMMSSSFSYFTFLYSTK